MTSCNDIQILTTNAMFRSLQMCAHLQHFALNRDQQLANGERRKVAIDHHAVRIGQPRVRKLLQQRLFGAEPVKAEIHAGADLGRETRAR